MRKRKTALRVLLFALMLTIFFCALSFSATAAPDDGGNGGDAVITDDGEPVDGGEVIAPEDGGETPQDGGQSIADDNVDPQPDEGQVEAPTTVPEDTQEQYQEQYEEPQNDYINRVDDLPDNISQYTPNENLENLPTVAKVEVAAATAEPLPDVEVSDASLFSGIVMWLCVAVGISVVAGVMVSKRTHRRGV